MKKAQATIFIILAIALVIGIIIYLVVRSNLEGDSIPSEFLPIFDYYESCIEYEAENALDLAGSQGGYIESDYVPGSELAPFGSHLNFMGFPVIYWYSISNNGLIEEKVPTLNEIEENVASFVEQGLNEECNFDDFSSQGFNIEKQDAEVDVNIEENQVRVNVNSKLVASKDGKNALKTEHETLIESKIGKFYSLARNIYNRQKEEAFLENYGADVLYLYAPVDGVEIQCSPKIWSTTEVMSNIRNGLEQNIPSIKLDGNYYSLTNKTREYFVLDEPVDEAINFVYSSQWPTKIEIDGEGVDDEIMITEPIGNQQGMGVMGFCYIPYHFVYDLSFPVLIQIYDDSEIFQFGTIVIIDNNLPREGFASEISYSLEEEFDLCSKKTENVEINLYDVNLENVNANISFECFDQKCRLGQTQGGKFRGLAPACLNGFIHVKTEGFADKKEAFSTNKEDAIDIILDREYELEVEVLLDGSSLKDTAILSFSNEDNVISIALPDQKTVKLSEASYDINLYIYGNSSIVIPSSSKNECVKVPKEGLLGMFGGTKEECFEINLPETKIEQALIGGGKINAYLLESDLEKGKIIINSRSLPSPKNLEELGNNFELFENRGFDVQFNEK